MSDSRRKTIVVVDDNPVNIQIIMSSFRNEYIIIPFTSGYDAIEFFKKGQRCDLILLDVVMPEIGGFDTIKVLKSMDEAKDIPVVFLTGNMETQSQVEGLTLGAVDYIFKPFNPPLVKKRIEIHIALEEYNKNLTRLVQEKTRTIEMLSDVTVSTIVSIIGTRDEETEGHISRTGEYVTALAKELLRSGLYTDELTDENILMLRKSAPLHDLGKVGISDSILTKPGRLTNEEFEIMKTHTIIGGEAFSKAKFLMNEPSFLDYAEQLAMYHHEKWNGQGYPGGLKGTDIPLIARIMAIADVYDALISKRPYKQAMSHETATKIIAESRGTHFDPDLCDAFLRINAEFMRIAMKFNENTLNSYEPQELGNKI